MRAQATAAEDDCAALLARLGAVAGSVATPGGACFFRDVSRGGGEDAWRARIVAVYGDVDALPDAAPRRLTGGAWGVIPPPAFGGAAAVDPLSEPDPAVDLTVSFGMVSGGGVVRIDRVDLRIGDAATATLSARLEGMPEVWPAEPGAAARMRLAALDLSIDLDGVPAIVAGGDDAPDAQTWRTVAEPWLAALDRDGPSAAAAVARRFAAALPHPAGRLEVSLGDLALRDAAPLLSDGLTPAALARVAAAAGLTLDWMPDAP